MGESPHEVTPQAVVEFSRRLLRMFAAKYGGDRTLNEIRVINQVLRCHLERRTCSVTALHNTTGIPIPTVSRAVSNLQSDGWLTDRPDPTDGRKRIISLGPRSIELTGDDIAAAVQWIIDFREHGLTDT